MADVNRIHFSRSDINDIQILNNIYDEYKQQDIKNEKIYMINIIKILNLLFYSKFRHNMYHIVL
jgi:hypothetical protein